jgi:hypothetical protein
MTPGDIMSLGLVLNDENMSPNSANNIRYYNLDLTTITFNNLSGQVTFVVPFDADFIRNGDEYTARAILEHKNNTSFTSNTVVDIIPFTIPNQPSFTRIDPSLLNPLVDAGFDLKLIGIEDETYWNGGSQLTSVKWIWSKVTGAGTGMIEFKIFNYDPAVNMYRIDVSNSMFADAIIDLSDNYEVSVVVRNLAGESIISQGQVLNALNLPDVPLGLMASVDTALSTSTNAVIQTIFHYPFDYANSNYKDLTYRVFWDLSNVVGLDSSYSDFTDASHVFNYSSPSYIYVNLNLNGSLVYNKTVYLKVQALNVNGGSPLSNITSIAPYSRSAAPTNLRVKLGPLDANQNTAIYASNDANDGSSNAIVYFTSPSPLLLGNDASFVRYEVLDNLGNVLGFNTNQSDSFVSVTGLTNFSQYNISVRVQTSYQTITYNGVSSSSINIIPFTYPVDVSLTSAIEGDAEVLVEWTSSDSHPGFPVYYRVGYKKTSDLSYTYAEINDDNTLSDSSFNFTDLINSQEYIFEITPFYVVQQDYYTVGGTWITNGTIKYYGNSITVTKVPIKNPTLGNINFTANLGPMKSDFSPANYANQIQNNYDGNNKVVLSWTPPLQTDLSLSAYVSFVKYEIADSNETIIFTSTDINQSIYILTSDNSGNVAIQNYVIGRYKIRATVSNGNVETTSDWSALTQNAAPFVYPINIRITNAVENDSQVQVEWTASDSHPEFPVYYRVGYKLTNDISYNYSVISVDNTLSDVSYNFTDLVNSFSYNFEITPFYIVNNQNYYGNSASVTKTPIDGPSLGNINFTAHYGPMKADLTAANYYSDISLGYDGNNKVVFTWVRPSDSDLGLTDDVSFVRYEIADSSNNNIYITNNINEQLYVLTSGVTNYQTEQYKIRAIITNGAVERTSDWSDLTVSAAPFVYPIDISITNAVETDSQVGVEWSASDSHPGFPVSYRVGYKLTNDASYNYTEIIVDNTLSDVSYNFTNLINSQSYIFEITPFYKLNNENYYGNSITVTKIPIKNPSLGNINFTANLGPMKSDLSAANYANQIQNNYDGNNKVVLSWTPPFQTDLGLSSYVFFVKYEIADSNETIVFTSTNRNQSIYVLTSNNIGNVTIQNYVIGRYKIRAIVSNGNVETTSDWSDLTVNAAPFVYPIDISINSAIENDSQVQVAWSASDSHSGFDVHYRIGYKLSGSLEYIYDETNDVSHNFTNLVNSSSYDFEITPFYNVNDEDYYGNSVTVRKTPLAIPLLGNISFTAYHGPMKADLSAANYYSDISLGYDGNNKVVLTWVRPSDSELGLTDDVYFVSYDIADSSETILYTTNDINEQLYVLTSGVTNYQTEQYKIRATVSNGSVERESDWSDLTVNAAPFVYPIDISINSAIENDSQVQVAWSASDSHSGFPVSYRIGYKLSVSYEFIYDVSYNVSYTFTGLTNSFSYDFEITPFYNVNNEDYYGNSVSVTRTPVKRPELGPINFTAHYGPMKLDLSAASYAEDASYNGNNQLVLTWFPPVDKNLGLSIDVSFVNYEIADSNGNILVTIPDRNIDLYVLTSADGVVNGTARQYKIRANVTNGLNTFTSLYSDLTANIAPFTFPAAPTNVATVGGDNNITVSWNSVGSQFSYTPKYYVQDDSNLAQDVSGTFVVRNYSIYGRHSGDVATFIEAPTTIIGTNNRYYSAPVAWSSVSYKAPDSIDNFQVRAGPLSSLSNAASILSNVVSGYDGSNSVILTWNLPNDSELGFGNGDGIRFLKYVITTPNNNTHDITDRNTLYYFVSPVDGVVDGQSKNYSIVVYTDVSHVPINTVVSSSVTVSNTSFTFPPALSGLGVVSDDTVANVSWNTFSHPIASIDKKFLIEWKLVSASGWDASAVVVNNVSYQITGLLNNSSYNVRVTPFITVTQTNDLGTNNYFGGAQNDFAYPIGTPVAVENFNVLTGPLKANLTPATFSTDVSLGNDGDNKVVLTWINPADISSWGNGSSVQFVRFEVADSLGNILSSPLISNLGSSNTEVVNTYNPSSYVVNGISKSFKVRAVTVNTDAIPVYKYGVWSNIINAIAFTFPQPLSGITVKNGNQKLDLEWTNLGLQYTYVPRYAIYIEGLLNQTTSDNAVAATVSSLLNDVSYNGYINTLITGIWSNASPAAYESYNSSSVSYYGVPTTPPNSPSIVSNSKTELDRNITFTLDSNINNNSYPLWTLNNYTLTITDEDTEISYNYTIPSNTTLYDVSNNAWGTMDNGHIYNFSIVGNYTFDDLVNSSYDVTTQATVFELSPYGKPIINENSTIVGFNSGDVQIYIDPNGRPLQNIWLVGIPDSLNTNIDNSWNFVYSSELDSLSNLPTSSYGEEILQLDDPFQSSGTDVYLKICYIFVSNLRGTSTYQEEGSDINF